MWQGGSKRKSRAGGAPVFATGEAGYGEAGGEPGFRLQKGGPAFAGPPG